MGVNVSGEIKDMALMKRFVYIFLNLPENFSEGPKKHRIFFDGVCFICVRAQFEIRYLSLVLLLLISNWLWIILREKKVICSQNK